MKPVFCIRPEPGWSATRAAGAEAGLAIGGMPLFAVEPVRWQSPDPARYDGLLIGSANVFRAGGPELAALAALPAHVVGEATADAARAAGFTVASCGEGYLQGVVDRLAADGARLRLLRLSGEERVLLDLPPTVTVDEIALYRVAALPLLKSLGDQLAGGGIVLLHSAAAARHFARECDRLALDRSRLALATYGPRISAAAGPGWQEVRHADRPAEAPLLALAAAMCHKVGTDAESGAADGTES